MVKRLLLGAVLAAALLGLGTCALFTDSLFPWYLSGVTDTLDLAGWIDAELVPEGMSANDWSLDLAVLRTAADEDTVFVAVHGFQGTRLIVLTSDLSLKAAAGDNPIDGLELGRRALVDMAGNFVIGTAILDGSTLADGGNTAGGRDEPGFANLSANFLAGVNNGVSPADLYYNRYNASWSSQASRSASVSSDLLAQWDLVDIRYDSQRPADQRVVALLRKWGTEDQQSAAQILYLPELEFEAGTLGGPLISTYPGFVVQNLDVQRMRYTRRGVVIRDHDNEAWLYRFSATDKQSLNFGSRHEILDAYDIDGEYFYCVDKDERMLYKGRTGW